MRILVSAYACEPGKGSEPEVGLQTVLAAAQRHEVWVLTRENNLHALRASLAEAPTASRIHLVGLDVPGAARRLKQTGLPLLHWYYDQWQRAAAERAVELDADVDFDVVHHATFAAFWARAGVSSVAKPFVWGPVGGGVETPLPLVGELGLRGWGEEMLRVPLRRLAAQAPARHAAERAARVVLVQNSETAARFTSERTCLLPHGLSFDIPVMPVVRSANRTKDIAFVGRLSPWKAGHLAVRTMRYVKDPDAVLHVYGKGPDRARMERAASRWGVRKRVRFEGHVSREELLARIAGSGVLLHPALHDESPIAVAESLSLGTPVVCLDHGGPRELVQHWPDSPSATVRPDRPDVTARQLAARVDSFLTAAPPVPERVLRPHPRFAEALLQAYDRAVDDVSSAAAG